MKVYFTAATSFNGEFQNQYNKILSYLREDDIKLLSGTQIVSKKLLHKDKLLSKAEIFEREHKLIDDADCIVAEVSKPSLGVGSEIAYALQKGKPVLALAFDPESQGTEDKISPMIAGNPSENLFLEYYNDESLPFTINNFLAYIKNIQKKRGKLIVIEGGDGSGKTTQAKLLVEQLRKNKVQVKYMDFPQYYPSFHGKTVAKFLRGEFGGIDQVSPYLASLAFALDRVSVKEQMEKFLSQGGLIIANRYATSNMAHQAAKFSNDSDKEKFLKWIYDLEYKVHKIPKEDIVIYLYVPWPIGARLSRERGAQKYLEGKEDIHEANIVYRKNVEEMYLQLTEHQNNWFKVDCVEDEALLPKEEIHRRILNTLQLNGLLTNLTIS